MDTVTGIMRELSSFSQTLKSRAEQITDLPERLEEKGLAIVHHSIRQLRKFSAVDAEVLKHTATIGHFSDAAKEALIATIATKVHKCQRIRVRCYANRNTLPIFNCI